MTIRKILDSSQGCVAMKGTLYKESTALKDLLSHPTPEAKYIHKNNKSGQRHVLEFVKDGYYMP